MPPSHLLTSLCDSLVPFVPCLIHMRTKQGVGPRHPSSIHLQPASPAGKRVFPQTPQIKCLDKSWMTMLLPQCWPKWSGLMGGLGSRG